MSLATIITKLKYLPALFLCSLFIFLPYFYHQKLITGIFNTDIYLLWFAGCVFWIFNVLAIQFTFKRLAMAVISGFVYVLLLFFLKSYNDINSINLLITLFSAKQFYLLFYRQKSKFLIFSQSQLLNH
jgi:hypothetical protein